MEPGAHADRGAAAGVPVVTVCSVDAVLRESAAGGILCDIPDAVVIRHDLLADSGQLRRVVYQRSGTIDDVPVPLEHACLTCALRQDIVSVATGLAATLSPGAIVLALPVAAEPRPVVRALAAASQRGIAVAGVLSVIDGVTAEWDILGDDLLDERDLAVADDDRRSVGEVLAHQIEYADVMLSPEALPVRAAALLDHLVGDADRRMLLHSADVHRLLSKRRDCADDTRGDLRAVAATGVPSREGVWTVDLQSWRPLHPYRLMSQLPRLGAGPLRGRGHFWLPTRQQTVCGWDGAGGQLSIGAMGTWEETPPRTRLVITGTDRGPADVLTAFDSVLMTDAELGRDLTRWEGRADGFDSWLGHRRRCGTTQPDPHQNG